jgi:hypothetical protein
MPNLFSSFSLPIADPLPLSTPFFSSGFALLRSLFCVFLLLSHHERLKTDNVDKHVWALQVCERATLHKLPLAPLFNNCLINHTSTVM